MNFFAKSPTRGSILGYGQFCLELLLSDTYVTCTNCGTDFPEGLIRCPRCRADRPTPKPLEERQLQRVHRMESSTPQHREELPTLQEVTVSWKSAWRIGIAVFVVAIVAPIILGVILFVLAFMGVVLLPVLFPG